jgi:GNAT superfamily N-acetyltransferase
MFVRPDWTRRGLGRRILEACEAAARAEGFMTLALMATLPGRPLYEAYGFRGTGVSTFRMPNGVEVGCEPMEMALA